MNAELWFHAVEILVMIVGIAVPALKASARLSSLMKDFPPHRHTDGKIIYPTGMVPTKIEELR